MLSFKKRKGFQCVKLYTGRHGIYSNKISKIEKKMRIDLLKMSNYTNYQIEPS